MDSTEITLEARNLTKRFGRLTAIRDLSFSISRGEIVGFLGPNGAGKSTTLRILSGLLPASSGSAFVCGVSVAREPRLAKRHIGFMAETNPLPLELRVSEYLRLRARLKKIPWADRKHRIEEAMEMCDLHRKARRKVIGTLSKGFRQRVGIADALLADPDVLILDEPTIGLDPHQVLAVRRLLASVRGRMTVLISSHILSEIEACCDQIIIVNQGRIVTSGTPGSLRSEFIPGERYRLSCRGSLESLKQSVRLLDERVEVTGPINGTTHDGFVDVSLRVPDQSLSGETLIRTLQRNGDVVLREVARVDPNLEDIFMAATRRSYDETGAPGKPLSTTEQQPEE